MIRKNGGGYGWESRTVKKHNRKVTGGEENDNVDRVKEERLEEQEENITRVICKIGYVQTAFPTLLVLIFISRMNNSQLREEMGGGKSLRKLGRPHVSQYEDPLERSQGGGRNCSQRQRLSNNEENQNVTSMAGSKGKIYTRDLLRDPLKWYLTCMTGGVLHPLNSGKGYQEQSIKMEGECSRSKGIPKSQVVNYEENEIAVNLTPVIDACEQEEVEARMARQGQRRGQGGRGRPRQSNQGDRPVEEPNNQRRGRRSTRIVIQEAACAYQEETDEGIHRIIQNLEERVLEEQSGSETEKWAAIVSDPGNTRGRQTLYRRSLHIYWVLKSLLAKALEQVAKEMAEIANGIPNVQKEMKNFQTIMINQNNKLAEISQTLSRIASLVPSQEDHANFSMETDKDTGTRNA